MLVGIDEAGRGPWAGPLVAAAVAFEPGTKIIGLNDSKIMTKIARDRVIREIQVKATSIGIGWVDSKYIDEFGLTAATSLAMQTAVDQLSCEFNLAVIDGNIDYLTGSKYRCEIKADQKYIEVSAASVVAKVFRDNYMLAVAQLYPEYGFEKHFGYGTKLHVQAMEQLGVLPIHRLSYKPVQKINVNGDRQKSRSNSL